MQGKLSDERLAASHQKKKKKNSNFIQLQHGRGSGHAYQRCWTHSIENAFGAAKG